jgi:hypothetical protein
MSSAVEVAPDPLAIEVTVVDAWVRKVDESQSAAIDAQQLLDDRPGQRDSAGHPTQLRCREELLDVVTNLEVERAELDERWPYRVAKRSISFRAQREVSATERRQTSAR